MGRGSPGTQLHQQEVLVMVLYQVRPRLSTFRPGHFRIHQHWIPARMGLATEDLSGTRLLDRDKQIPLVCIKQSALKRASTGHCHGVPPGELLDAAPGKVHKLNFPAARPAPRHGVDQACIRMETAHFLPIHRFHACWQFHLHTRCRSQAGTDLSANPIHLHMQACVCHDGGSIHHNLLKQGQQGHLRSVTLAQRTQRFYLKRPPFCLVSRHNRAGVSAICLHISGQRCTEFVR